MSRAAVLVAGLFLALVPGSREGVGVRDAVLPGFEPWGLAVGMYPDEAARRGFPFPPDLGEVAALGARSVLIPVSLFQGDLRASVVGPGDRTPSDAQIAAVASEARAHGLEVALMPMLELRQGAPHAWRGRIHPRDPARWWHTYEDQVLHYAAVAARVRAAAFVVGSELTSMSEASHADRWRRLVRRVRTRFRGK
ncbi:MAG: glycoside hydrolase family 113, partial [Myxococcota bacterium]